jgi:phosphatidate cytidylyltransferase
MLVKRTASAVVILIAGLILVFSGGLVFSAGVGIILAAAVWEFAVMFIEGGYHPARCLMVGGTFILTSAIPAMTENNYYLAFCFFGMVLIISHIMTYSSNQEHAAADMAISLSGILFITYMGNFLVRLRFLPDGLGWILIGILPAGISDIGAYFIGSLIGRHKLAPLLSPGKSVEGLFGGILTACGVGAVAGVILNPYFEMINPTIGISLGLVSGIMSPLGDLAKSMIKRQFGLKHTGSLIPGHGGVLDRIDTWLWAGVTSYTIITMFLMK